MENNRIRDVRKAAGMTQAQLAKSLGVNRATLSRYESGDIDPPSSQLQRIADVLGVDIRELTGNGETTGSIRITVPRENKEYSELMEKYHANTITESERKRLVELLNMRNELMHQQNEQLKAALVDVGNLMKQINYTEYINAISDRIGDLVKSLEYLRPDNPLDAPPVPSEGKGTPPAEPPADGIRMITVFCPSCGAQHVIREDASTHLCKNCLQSLNNVPAAPPPESPQEGE